MTTNTATAAIKGGTSGYRPALTLVVPTVGRSEVLQPLFQSLARQTVLDFEIIVVDQNSDDRVAPFITVGLALGLLIRHHKPSKLGATFARNAGMALASGGLIGFPDDDCWYEPDVVARVIAAFQNDPALDGAIGHWIEHDPQGLRPPERLELAKWRRYKGGDAACFALFFNTARLKSVCGFSENFGPGRYFGAAEEEEVILRLLSNGALIDYVPRIHIHHPHADVPLFTAQQRRRNRLYGRGTGAVQAKHKLPAWVIARGLVGPFAHAIKATNPMTALALGVCTVWGRIEGLSAWWLWGHREGANSQVTASSPSSSASQ